MLKGCLGRKLTYAVGARYLMLLVKADLRGITKHFLAVSVVRQKQPYPTPNKLWGPQFKVSVKGFLQLNSTPLFIDNLLGRTAPFA